MLHLEYSRCYTDQCSWRLGLTRRTKITVAFCHFFLYLIPRSGVTVSRPFVLVRRRRNRLPHHGTKRRPTRPVTLHQVKNMHRSAAGRTRRDGAYGEQ
ncbi:hypothetical protein K1T71_007327 [Dendrolimus kikuchii]|uniref:Uncharacterized protein n=1 Tax=Dendrolimus kikuchii TaxID=765133 RepID=A0ACC1D0A5_9NEOP|nr:hypothetical protein K1T71_007327 [Dendrolimus kikuchii]